MENNELKWKRKLRNCPFCGGEPLYYSFDPYDGYQGNCVQHNVRCRKCSATMVSTNEKKVKEKWNRRANDGTN